MHTRRQFLRAVGVTTAGVGLRGLLATPALAQTTTGIPALGAADANGWQLPPGFTSRVLATSDEVVPGTAHTWHRAPDGGAVFPDVGGGWTYVSNAELANGNGGAGALHLGADGVVTGASTLLDGTSRNCSGGPTPWGTWLSCEETTTGHVHECDPSGAVAGVVRPAMGTASFEAAACDEQNEVVYLTEDNAQSGLLRFTPDVWGDLSTGRLDVLTESGGVLSWQEVPDPSASSRAIRNQVPGTVRFNGAEGIWMDGETAVWTTKGDNRVWSYHPTLNTLVVVYDFAVTDTPVLSGVDNVIGHPDGGVIVAEDGGNMELVLVARDGRAAPIARLTGVSNSELTGPAFDPTGTRLYVSSQRNPGRTYELAGPWASLVMDEAPDVGTVDLERWLDRPGGRLVDIRDGTPFDTTERLVLSTGGLEAPWGVGDRHGTRLRARFVPPADGAYRFHLASDNEGVLLLNQRGQDAAGAVVVATCPYATGRNRWDKYPEQASAVFHLQGGRAYHLAAICKENKASDHLSVGVQRDGGPITLVPAEQVRPAVEAATGWYRGPVGPPPTPGAGSITMDEWLGVSGGRLTNVPVGAPPTTTTTLVLAKFLEPPINRGDEYALRLRGLLTPPTTGPWTFWIAANQRGALLLNPEGTDPAGATVVAKVTKTVGRRRYDLRAEQQSAPLDLVGGVALYVEVLLKEGRANDHVSVAWQVAGTDAPALVPRAAVAPTTLGAGGWRVPPGAV